MTTAALVSALSLTLSLAGPSFARMPVEPYGGYQPQVSCDPVAKPGTIAFRSLILRRFGDGSDLGIGRACEVPGTSEHKEGRAWDWGLDATNKQDRQTAREALTWLTETNFGDPARRARRLGIMYIIWNERIWSSYRASEGWRPYAGASPHKDHVHFSLTWNGATKQVSWWTREVMPYDHGPCPRWLGEYAPRWTEPRLTPCPEPIRRPVANERGIYTVQTGDTLHKVAGYFGRTTQQIRDWNDLRASRVVLHEGQKVRVAPR